LNLNSRLKARFFQKSFQTLGSSFQNVPISGLTSRLCVDLIESGVVDSTIQVEVVGTSARKSISLLAFWLLLLNRSIVSVVVVVVVKSTFLNSLRLVDQPQRLLVASSVIIVVIIISTLTVLVVVVAVAVHFDDLIYLTFTCKKNVETYLVLRLCFIGYVFILVV
jgi:hypothetical protein